MAARHGVKLVKLNTTNYNNNEVNNNDETNKLATTTNIF